jgi:succinate dehydrogenase / fumarate reductase membrane anchor subunit
MTNYRTPLSRARGLGSAKHGVGAWISERVTAIALVPLTLWAVYAALKLTRLDHAGTAAWLAQPVNAVLAVLLVVFSVLHMHGGMRVVIEDYYHKGARTTLLLVNFFVCVLAAALAVFCILKVALGGA